VTISAKFQEGWSGPELPGYREIDATYGYFPLTSLPPLEQKLDGSFSWLTPMDAAVRKELEPHWRSDRSRSKLRTQLEPILAEAGKQGYELPPSFVSFMRSEVLQQRVPSCTACYFDAPDRIVPAPPPAKGILIRFMNDQQWCILWYLYVERGGAHAVVTSDVALDLVREEEDEESGQATPHLLRCAAGFEEFIYRSWIENSAWFALNERHRELSPVEKRYLAHYRS